MILLGTSQKAAQKEGSEGRKRRFQALCGHTSLTTSSLSILLKSFMESHKIKTPAINLPDAGRWAKNLSLLITGPSWCPGPS